MLVLGTVFKTVERPGDRTLVGSIPMHSRQLKRRWALDLWKTSREILGFALIDGITDSTSKTVTPIRYDGAL